MTVKLSRTNKRYFDWANPVQLIVIMSLIANDVWVYND